MDRPSPKMPKYLYAQGILLVCLAAVLVVAAKKPTSTLKSTQITNEPTPTLKPTLIVRAHTNLENQGAPTLDVHDVERYFAKDLSDHYVKNVITSSTNQLAQSPVSNTYQLEVCVDALQTSERAHWSYLNRTYESQSIFGMDISLPVKDLSSRKVLGVLRHRIEREIDPSQKDFAEKKSAIYDATEDLARSFLGAWAAGEFGPELPAENAPSTFERIPNWAKFGLVIFDVIAAIYLFVLFIRFIYGSIRFFAPATEPLPAPRPRTCAAPAKTHYASWDGELEYFFALALKTDNFSEAACQAAAAAKRDAILADHDEIEAKEAKRQLRAKLRELHYEELATRGAESSGLEKAQIIELLRKADAWQYRVLEKAKRQALEASR